MTPVRRMGVVTGHLLQSGHLLVRLGPGRALLEIRRQVLDVPPIFVYDATFYGSEAVEGIHGILGRFRYDRDEGQIGRLVPPQRYAQLSHTR